MSYLEDPLDSDNFDPVEYINQRFPTEASLDDLDDFIIGIGSQISSLDEDISKAVQTQSVIGKQASKDIVETQQSIVDLFGKIDDIKQKASQSERMVQEICADIKKLDYAKNHLQTSITSLNRLQMLINAVGQLEVLAHEHQYREVANLLDAVKQFMSHFEEYAHINMVQGVQQRVDTIREDLTEHIGSIFRELAQNADSVADAELAIDIPGGLHALSDACLVVDSLGTRARRKLLDEFVQLQLVPYENLFGVDKQYFSLDQVERRWSWFKRLLKYVDSKFASVFPKHWRLPLRLCLEFAERTKIHLVLLLTEMESSDSSDVHSLLKALQSALRFEQDISDKFNLLEELQQSKQWEEAAAKAVLAEETRMHRRLKENDKLMYVPTDHDAINKEDETESGFLALAHAAVAGGISGVFDKFLGSYVLLERQNLEDMLRRLGEEEDVTSEGVGMGGGAADSSYGNVYGSSTNMFVFIKNSIKRCTALTTGHTFLALSKEFQACMLQYIDMLKNRCPVALTVGTGSNATVVYRLPPGGEIQMCYLINTGEYCAEVVPQLEQMIQQKILSVLTDKVCFEDEVDAFMDLVAHCIKVLVAGVLDKMDTPFKAMAAINWGTMTQVGEESPYVHSFHAVLVEVIPRIRESLSASYVNNLCTKIATEFLQKYLDLILKQKRITDVATQQLLLDMYSVKTLLLQMPQIQAVNNDSTGVSSLNTRNGDAVNAPKPSSPMYVKLVNQRVAHIEMILKLIGTPEEMLLERFRIMWPNGQPSDLQLLMSLKGTKRNDQQVILEMLGLSAASKIINKTANTIFTGTAGATNDSNNASNGGSNGVSSNVANNITPDGTASTPPVSSYSSVASAAAASVSASAASSMKSFKHDFSSSTAAAGRAMNVMGNLKWTTGGSSTSSSK